jgi:hypothetical protein
VVGNFIIIDNSKSNINYVFKECNSVCQNKFAMEFETDHTINLTSSSTIITRIWNSHYLVDLLQQTLPCPWTHPAEHRYAAVMFLLSRMNQCHINSDGKNKNDL